MPIHNQSLVPVAGRKDLVRWLLSMKKDAANASNKDGRCPLHIAAITNNIEMCKVVNMADLYLQPECLIF